MFIFLYGPDDYRRLTRKREVVADFKKKYPDLGPAYFDLEDDGALDELGAFVQNQSIFEPAKLAVLENVFEMEEAKLAKILKLFAGDRATTILVSERNKPVKALAFLLAAPSVAEKFENLAGAEWIDFIRSEAKKLGLTLGVSAAQFLATVYAGNSWALVTELTKLASMKRTIEKKDLDALDLEAAPNYWGLVNGMKSYDVRTRLYALETLFATNDPPPKIFNILAGQAGEKTPRMAEYDLMVKSGKLEYEEALLDLILV